MKNRILKYLVLLIMIGILIPAIVTAEDLCPDGYCVSFGAHCCTTSGSYYESTHTGYIGEVSGECNIYIWERYDSWSCMFCPNHWHETDTHPHPHGIYHDFGWKPPCTACTWDTSICALVHH